MEQPRPEKVAVVDEVRARLSESDASILTQYRGMTVKNFAELRGALRPSGAQYKVYKNTLVRLAVRELELSDLEESLTGPTAIAFVKGDVVAVAKVLRDFARTNPNLIVKGGLLGKKALSAKDAASLADLPSREAILAQFAGLLAQPMRQFAGLLQALPRNFAYGLQALIEKSGGVVSSESTPSSSEHQVAETSEAESAEAMSADISPSETQPAEVTSAETSSEQSDAEPVSLAETEDVESNTEST